jgi:hypothetical protein
MGQSPFWKSWRQDDQKVIDPINKQNVKLGAYTAAAAAFGY